jgi:plasmid stabilization system protein ParE
MRMELSRFVEGDLDDIAAYIAQDNPHRAVRFIQDIRARFRDIQRNPLIYQIRSDIGDEARKELCSSGGNVIRYIFLIHLCRWRLGGAS